MPDLVPTPSELLTRAADLIRDTAAAAEAGPWFAEVQPSGSTWVNSQQYRHAISTHGFADTAHWIALLNPSLAPALETWLREAAQNALIIATLPGSGIPDDVAMWWSFGPAMTFARAVLGLVDTPESPKEAT